MNIKTNLDLHDIQGNIIKGYGRFGFPKARYIFYHITKSKDGRQFILNLLPKITNSAAWNPDNPNSKIDPIPNVTTNIALTYTGLKRLGISQKSLQSFPEEFAEGMKARRTILGDNQKSAPENWDPIWNLKKSIDIFISINGKTIADVEQRYQEICNLISDLQGVIQLKGHRGENQTIDLPYQEASALYDDNGQITAKEHFGYTDGISDPYFKGSGINRGFVVGGGKLTGKNPQSISGWKPLETGEFILGHKDEAYEYPQAPIPRLLSHNGTFMVYRKLHQNIGSFNKYLEEEGNKYPEGKEALAAKFVGRWRNGAPISLFPTEKEANDFAADLEKARKKYHEAKNNNIIQKAEKELLKLKYYELLKKLVAFDYDSNIEGSRCPVGAHMRRANPRGSLEFDKKGAFKTPGALVNRRRIARRGLPYGKPNWNAKKDNGNHGIIFMAINASIRRQFEFVQQQWINYGNDLKLANEKDPIIGNHCVDKNGKENGRMIIPGDKTKNKAPHFCQNIPRFVEVRGGEYFFIPSITALEMIGKGIVDPT